MKEQFLKWSFICLLSLLLTNGVFVFGKSNAEYSKEQTTDPVEIVFASQSEQLDASENESTEANEYNGQYRYILHGIVILAGLGLLTWLIQQRMPQKHQLNQQKADEDEVEQEDSSAR